jgi:hypothetical protein
MKKKMKRKRRRSSLKAQLLLRFKSLRQKIRKRKILLASLCYSIDS